MSVCPSIYSEGWRLRSTVINTRFEQCICEICESVGIATYAVSKNGADVVLRFAKGYVKHHGLDPKGGDLVAIVMDLDDRFSREQIVDLQRRCDALGYKLFLSNPSFEVWLLCHFNLPSHPYTPSELVDDMKVQLGGEYKKSRGFELDDPMVDRAIINARKLLPDDECTPEGCFEHNPSTMVHSLVETIRKRIKRRRGED